MCREIKHENDPSFCKILALTLRDYTTIIHDFPLSFNTIRRVSPRGHIDLITLLLYMWPLSLGMVLIGSSGYTGFALSSCSLLWLSLQLVCDCCPWHRSGGEHNGLIGSLGTSRSPRGTPQPAKSPAEAVMGRSLKPLWGSDTVIWFIHLCKSSYFQQFT